jgi:hypothetical protein
MELFTRLFGDLLTLYTTDSTASSSTAISVACPGRNRWFVTSWGIPVVSKGVLSRRTDDYRNWVEAYGFPLDSP